MKIIGAIAISIAFGLTASVAYIYSGMFNVAATTQDSSLVKWFLENTRTHSIRSRSEQINVPPLTNNVQLEAGSAAYHEMCSNCHGAPGKEPFLGASDMNPSPPDLTAIADKRTPKELFWVVKNGIRMTGMPAWGPSHDDEEIWSLVAFIKRLPKLTPDAYRGLIDIARETGHGHHTHEHAEGEKVNGDTHHDDHSSHTH